MVREKTVVIGFLVTIILLAIIFIIVKVNNDDEDEDDELAEALNAISTTVMPRLCPCALDKDDGGSSEEHTTPSPASAEGLYIHILF